MAKALKHNHVLLSFKYEPGHAIDNEIVIESMAEALAANTTLREFSIHTNGIVTGTALAEIIHCNSTLHSFGGASHGVKSESESITSIASAIRQNSTLKSVMLDYSDN